MPSPPGRGLFGFLVDVVAGAVNSFTGGLFDKVLSAVGLDGWYDKTSIGFQIGGYIGQAAMIAATRTAAGCTRRACAMMRGVIRLSNIWSISSARTTVNTA